MVAIEQVLHELFERYKSDSGGTVASYIPELAKYDPDLFAISVVTVDGQQFSVGNFDQPFTIQSISKPFSYAMALQDHGREFILSHVGVEPTGNAFNSIISLDERSKRPHNPMVNAGAIALASLCKGDNPTQKLNRSLDFYRKFLGRKVHIDMPVYLSEKTSGDRNRALAYLMKNFGMIDGNLEEVLDLYFQECSIVVNSGDLALMAATLANKGVNPITQVQAVESKYIKDILSVMFMCGLYDFSGEWAYRVGLPAKSGVGGGIIAVVPGRMGVGVFSPALDERGNSVRGVKVCEALSQHYGLHIFDAWYDKASSTFSSNFPKDFDYKTDC